MEHQIDLHEDNQLTAEAGLPWRQLTHDARCLVGHVTRHAHMLCARQRSFQSRFLELCTPF